MTEKGTLYIVATPIGNTQDMTPRALEVLKEVSCIYAEDTRNTKKLLQIFGAAPKKIETYNEHTGDSVVLAIFKKLEEGESIAYVSDAGTPAISDPGARLIEKLQQIADKHGDGFVQVSPIPGASAVISAMSICGFPGTSFTFLGFPPHKKGRQTFFQLLANMEHVAVFFESSHRIEKALQEIYDACDPMQEIVICRELTKAFETIHRCKVKDLLTQKITQKGEFVLVLRPKN